VKKFLEKHQAKIVGTLSCFDRILFKGYLPISWSDSMERFIHSNGLLIKDFKRFVSDNSQRIKDHAKEMARNTRRPFVSLTRSTRKEDAARRIAERDGITEGLVCIFSAVEGCQSFKMIPGEGRPRIVNAARKCLCLYFYFIDRTLGFMHVRMQTWFPFTIQVCLNGHDVLACKMDRHGIGYARADNAFVWIEDLKRAQSIADNLVRRNWARILSAFARRVNPLMKDLLGGMDYYWITEQSEYATDIMFRDHASLTDLYRKLLEHTMMCFSAGDVMTFLGKKGIHGNFKGEVISQYKRRWPGTRVKHRMKENWIKMYDKQGCVLRVETVINHPYDFKIRRMGKRGGEWVMDWYPMAKRVTNLYRYAEVSLAANGRYLDALSVVDDPETPHRDISHLAQPVHRNGRSYRGFNPIAKEDVALFNAIMRGDYCIMGFRNKDIRAHLFGSAKLAPVIRRQSAKVSLLLKRLHLRGLIAKIPRSRRWRVSEKGHALMSTALKVYHRYFPERLMQCAS